MSANRWWAQRPPNSYAAARREREGKTPKPMRGNFLMPVRAGEIWESGIFDDISQRNEWERRKLDYEYRPPDLLRGRSRSLSEPENLHKDLASRFADQYPWADWDARRKVREAMSRYAMRNGPADQEVKYIVYKAIQEMLLDMRKSRRRFVMHDRVVTEEPDMDRWVHWFAHADTLTVVAHRFRSGRELCTIFAAVELGDPNPKTPPLVFETFLLDGGHREVRGRWSSIDEAEVAHGAQLAELEASEGGIVAKLGPVAFDGALLR